MLVGPARRGDLAQIVALNVAADDAERAFSPDLVIRRPDLRLARRTFVAALRDPDQRLLVARVGHTLVGMLGVDLHRARHRYVVVRRHAYLHSLYVAPAFRGQRIARQLVRLGLRHAARRGAQQVRLEMAAANGAARRLYEAAGFRLREMMFTRDLR